MADTPASSVVGLPQGAATEFDGAMSYGDYLALDELLSLQRPRTQHHDEVLFVIVH